MAVEIRSPAPADEAGALALVGSLLPGMEEAFGACVARAPELALVAVQGTEVVGVCFAAVPHEGEGVVLDGLAVDGARVREGLGSRLLAAFEERVAAAGFTRVSLGSAEGYVEDFYLQNGYIPVEFQVTTAEGEPPLDESLEVLRFREADEALVLNVASEHGYTQAEKERIRELTSAHEVIFVFEKRLEPS
jgi:GNAT superfamily N-acetyltransferase